MLVVLGFWTTRRWLASDPSIDLARWLKPKHYVVSLHVIQGLVGVGGTSAEGNSYANDRKQLHRGSHLAVVKG